MAEIIKRNKALSVSPLKASSTIGAALAFLGLRRSIPMLHGSQGCTAFGKVFFVRHFREPIPLQSTAMDQVTSVMGANENVVEGLRTVCEKSAPELIGVPTTGLAETQGADIHMAVREFRAKYPQFDAIPVVAVSTPDFTGCLESGFAALHDLDEAALVRILTEPRNALVRQYQQLFSFEGVSLEFTPEALAAIARKAIARGTGARGLRSVLEGLLQRTMFDLPSIAGVTRCRVDEAAVLAGNGEGLIQVPEREPESGPEAEPAVVGRH